MLCLVAKGGDNVEVVQINAKFVRQMLLDLEIDQRELAKMSGVSEPTITRLLQGKPFTSDTLVKLAKALECNPIDLIDARGFASPHVGAPTFANIRTQ